MGGILLSAFQSSSPNTPDPSDDFARQEALLKARPRKVTGSKAPGRSRRFLQGFAETLRTGGRARGLLSPAAISTPALIAGTKDWLGQ